jgi:hypothetical protein
MSAPPNFNRLARLYRWMEFFSFGPWLALTRRTFLPSLAGRRSALVLGDGDGRFTASLLRLNAGIDVDAVDASPAMLHALVRRAGPHAMRVRTHAADARDIAGLPGMAQAGYDLVATHFFLDCLTTGEVETLAEAIRPRLLPDAVWVISDFAVPPGLFGRLAAAPLIAALYLSFGILTGLKVRVLPDHPAALGRAGFSLVERRSRLAGLLVAELWRVEDPLAESR